MIVVWAWIGAGLALLAAVYCFVLAEKVYSDARLARVNADELALLNNRVDMLQTGIKRIEGRQVKADQRTAKAHHSEVPDPKVDPEGWKQWQNRQIATARSKLQ